MELEYYIVFLDIFGILLGKYFYLLQDLISMKSLVNGVLYYGEVHTSNLNRYIHTLCMPFTATGALIWFPAMLKLNSKNASIFRNSLFWFYLSHYYTISIQMTTLVAILYYPSIKYSNFFYNKINNYKISLFFGLCLMTFSLTIQELVGHYLGGDDASRIEAIPNAIIYAPYFSVSHFF